MQSIAVAGICPAGCAAHHQSSPVGGRNRHLHPKLIGLLRFAFSDGVNPWDWTACDKEFKPLAGQVVIQTVLAIHNPRRSASAGDSQRLCEKPVSQMELLWQSVDKQSGRCTKNLRPLAMSLDFGSSATKSPWLSALTGMGMGGKLLSQHLASYYGMKLSVRQCQRIIHELIRLKASSHAAAMRQRF
jgi:hypothetical protein